MYGKGFNDIFNDERLTHSFNIPQDWETVLQRLEIKKVFTFFLERYEIKHS